MMLLTYVTMKHVVYTAEGITNMAFLYNKNIQQFSNIVQDVEIWLQKVHS